LVPGVLGMLRMVTVLQCQALGEHNLLDHAMLQGLGEVCTSLKKHAMPPAHLQLL
jgi:hypothetical protein